MGVATTASALEADTGAFPSFGVGIGPEPAPTEVSPVGTGHVVLVSRSDQRVIRIGVSSWC